MIEVVHQSRGSPRIDVRKILLRRLGFTGQPRQLYRALDQMHLRYSKQVYPRRPDVTLLLAQAAPPTSPTTVPNVVGDPLAVGVSAISVLGLLAQPITFQNSTTIPFGIIIFQSPMAGLGVPTGSSVALGVSSGSATGFRVMAVSAGEYGGEYYEPGDVFDLQFSADYSDSTQNYQIGGNDWAPGWMLQVPNSTPLLQQEVVQAYPTFPAVDPARRFVM